jgi:hypothetical protein
MAHANPHNLMGFLDAFKAVVMSWLMSKTGSAAATAPSLTPCEDFA